MSGNRTRFISVRNVSYQYPVSYRKVYEAIESGTIPNFTIPGCRWHKIFMFRTDVERWLATLKKRKSHEI